MTFESETNHETARDGETPASNGEYFTRAKAAATLLRPRGRLMQKVPTQFLVTIDRDCRTIFLADRERNTCEPLAEIEQRLDSSFEASLTPDSRAWNRGLKTIHPIEDGYVTCDVYGVYQLDRDFRIQRYLSIPQFTDIHSAFPSGDLVLVSNTGDDKVLWVDWDGRIHDSINLHQWFPATPWMENDLAQLERERGGDLRLMPLDWARESCHVNWAEETALGTMVSCFIQGDILFFRNGKPVRRVPARAKIHSPRYLPETETILFAASEENRIAEIDMEGTVLWSMDGFSFAKYVDRLPGGKLIVADTGNQRIAIIDKQRRRIVWECALPGTPYCVMPFTSARILNGTSTRA